MPEQQAPLEMPEQPEALLEMPMYCEDHELFEMASETKKLGNRYVGEKRFQNAIQRYSEAITQANQLERKKQYEIYA